MSQGEVRTYFQVPFGEKDDAKALGARFDGNRKSWFAPDDYVKEAMAVRWQMAANQAPGSAPPMQQQWQPGQYGGAPAGGGDFKVLYDVPFEAKDQAKSFGARFDGSARKWYAPDEGVAQQMDAYWPRANVPMGGYGGGGGGYSAPGQENQWYNGPRNHAAANVQQPADGSKVYFQVSFDENTEAKSMGARFDGNVKCWYGDNPDSIAALSQRFARR